MDFIKVTQFLAKAGGELTAEKVDQSTRVYFDSLSDEQRAKLCDRVSGMSVEELAAYIVAVSEKNMNYDSADIIARVLHEFYLLYKQHGNLKFLEGVKRGGEANEGSSDYDMIRYSVASALREMPEKDAIGWICAYDSMDKDHVSFAFKFLTALSRGNSKIMLYAAIYAATSLKKVVSEYQEAKGRSKESFNGISF